MKLKYGTKYIYFIGSIACICLILINLDIKDNNNKTNEDKISIIMEAPKKANLPESKELGNEEGTPVIVDETNEKSIASMQPLPVLDPNAIIVITPLQ